MNRIFRFEMAVKTGLIVTLALAVVLAAGCPKKQDKSVKTPPAPASSEKKPPVQNTGIKAPVAEANQNAVATPAEPVTGKKPTVAAQTPAKEVKPSAASTQQALKPTAPEPADLKPYESLKETEEKVDFITEYADQHPESEALMVYKVLDDNDVEVRTAAMEMLAMKELNDPNVIYVAAKALKDSELQIRESAIEACSAVTDPAVGNVLIEALNDSSEEVRNAAIQAADQKEMPIRLPVLKAGITSQNEDVKEDAVSSLIDASTPEAVDILIEGLKDSNPEFRDSVKSAIDFLVSPDKEFETYDQAVKWWNANRNKFDNELNAKD
jgi:hypothetical protein